MPMEKQSIVKTSLPVLNTVQRKHPQWIKAQFPMGDNFVQLRNMVHRLNLHTVCESAKCPNIGECWNEKALTIMILGDICTRSCRFCDVKTGKPNPPDPNEPKHVGQILSQLNLKHTVITCVDRDDLTDGGAHHWAETIGEVKKQCHDMTLEVLTGDFKGETDLVDIVLDAKPDVFSHNLETVPRLSREVRVQASYERSYRILEHAVKQQHITKTGIMLGLGETIDEVKTVIRECASLGIHIFSMGQYLRPSTNHLPITRYVHPDEFAELKNYALSQGLLHVESGPLVRSSYHAEGQAAIIRNLLNN